MKKKNLVLAVLFVLANVAAASATSSLTNAGAPATEGRALTAEHYEDATDAELAAAYADSPVVCVAADTPSGCR